MTEFKGVSCPDGLFGVRNVYLHKNKLEGGWLLSTRACTVIGKFESDSKAEEWWLGFELERGFEPKKIKRFAPPGRKSKVKYTKIKKAPPVYTSSGFSVFCPMCQGDGGVSGNCFKCGGTGWA